MTKRLIALAVIAVMLLGLLVACGKSGPLTTDDAKKVVLNDLGVKESKVDSIDIHITSAADGTACYAVYVTINGEHLEYVVNGLTGEILSVQEADEGHHH